MILILDGICNISRLIYKVDDGWTVGQVKFEENNNYLEEFIFRNPVLSI